MAIIIIVIIIIINYYYTGCLKKNTQWCLMAHNPDLESPKYKRKDSFGILRFSAFIWAQEQGHFMQKWLRKSRFKLGNWAAK